MYRRDGNLDATPFHPDRDRWDEADWTADRDEPRPARPGFFGRLGSLLKVAGLILPVAFYLYGNFADCSARPAASWLGLVGAGACARSEMLGSVLSMQDNFAFLKRLID